MNGCPRITHTQVNERTLILFIYWIFFFFALNCHRFFCYGICKPSTKEDKTLELFQTEKFSNVGRMWGLTAGH